MTIEDKINKKGRLIAISDTMFGVGAIVEETDPNTNTNTTIQASEEPSTDEAERVKRNIKCIENFMKTYKGTRPYLAFVMENVAEHDLGIFVHSILSYDKLNDMMMKIKKNTKEEPKEDTEEETKEEDRLG